MNRRMAFALGCIVGPCVMIACVFLFGEEYDDDWDD